MFNRIARLAALDFYSIKPYIRRTNVLFSLLLGIGFAIVMNTPLILIIGIMGIGTSFASTVFALGDVHRLNILHTTIPVSRKDIVYGRYVFSILITAFFGIIGFLLAYVMMWAIGIAGLGEVAAFAQISDSIGANVPVIFVLIMLVFAQNALVLAVIFPIYFKYGYMKANRFSFLPNLFTMLSQILIILIFIRFGDDAFADNILPISLICVLVTLCAFAVSIKLSLRVFLRKDI